MAEPWIRVHAILIDKPVVSRAVAALGVSEHAAVGLLVTFWGAVARNVVAGSLAGVSDAHLENWARWRGKRGRFAAFVREYHLDGDGRVNEWDDYAGALEQRRAKERDRLRNKRTDVAQQDANNSPTPAQQIASVATRAPERNGTVVTTTAKATTSRRQPRVESNGTAKVTWLSPLCAVWESLNGAGSFAGIAGQTAKALSPLVKAGHSSEEIAERLETYMAANEPKFWNINKFAQTYGQWAQQELVTADGEWTEYGERLTRPGR